MCGIYTTHDPRRILTYPRRHPRKRLSTGAAPSLAVALASVDKFPKMMTVRQKCSYFSCTESLEIFDVRDDLVNRMLWDILAYTPNLRSLVLHGCTRVDDATV